MKSHIIRCIGNGLLCIMLGILFFSTIGIGNFLFYIILGSNILFYIKDYCILKNNEKIKKILSCIKFPGVIELINIVAINFLLIVNFKENDNIFFGLFELMKVNGIYLVNFIMFIIIWESKWKGSLFGYLRKKSGHSNHVEDKKYLDLSLDGLKRQLNRIFIGIATVCIGLIFFRNNKGVVFNTFDFAMISIIIFPLVMIFTETVIYLKLETLEKDSFWSLNVWNYLIYKEEINKRQEGKDYLTNRDIFFRNRGSITLEEISNVRESLRNLKEDELINLIYLKNTPYYFDDFYFSGQRMLKIVKNIILSLSTIGIGGDIIVKSFQGEGGISELLNKITIDWYMILLIGVILMLMYLPILALYHLLNCTQKRKQVDYLLDNLIAKECTERKLGEYNIKSSSEMPKKNFLDKFIRLKKY